mgnify:CR=1 FL=1
MVTGGARHVLDLLYPPVCPFCGKISPEGICAGCRKKIVYVREPRCMRCGKPLRDEIREYCRDCEARSSFFDRGYGMWLHREPVSGAVYRFKYKNKRNWGRIFAVELAEHYEGQIRAWGIEEIIPIPLHSTRKRKRGFNQSEVVAGILSELTGIPCRTDVLFRIRKTVPQKQLDRRGRKDNLMGAFGVSREWNACENVLLIDDIYTTGTTVGRAAKMLKKAGAQNVYFLTISIGQGI